MEGQVALVTGSSSGIGEETALQLAKLNVRLVIHGVNQERIKDVAQRCAQVSPSNHKPLEVAANLLLDDDVRRLFEATIEHYGRLDILVNNAGFFRRVKVDEPNIYQVTKELMKLNYESAVLLTSLCVPYLKEAKGSIVNVSSNLAKKNIDGSTAYSATKAALTMFTSSCAIDLAPDVRVNSVSPGPVRTRLASRIGMDKAEFWDSVADACVLGRVGEVEDVAELIVFLVSPKAKWITGADYLVDGGASIKPTPALTH